MIIIGGKTLEGVGVGAQCDLRGCRRPALNLYITGSSYAELAELFVDNAAFSLRHGGEDYDQSEYCLAGPITDHRDGTFSVIMGKKTELEELREYYDRTQAVLPEETK